MFTHAITRKPGKNFACGITTSNLGIPSYDLIIKQHDAYISTLISLGLEVTILEALPEYPDGYFVEDTAVVTPDIAVITNPGAAARKGEQITIEPVLAKYRNIEHIEQPGTVDGGDVLMIGTHFFIGISSRTNEHGAKQLGHILEKYGNTWATIPITTGLHLKSSVNYVGKNNLLITEEFSDNEKLSAFNKIIIDRTEEYTCNTLLINNCLIIPKVFPDTKKKLNELSFEIIELDISEVRKMDGGLTCMSLRF
jgi:dimethylargininase